MSGHRTVLELHGCVRYRFECRYYVPTPTDCADLAFFGEYVSSHAKRT